MWLIIHVCVMLKHILRNLGRALKSRAFTFVDQNSKREMLVTKCWMTDGH